ncbi:nucleoside triphosphate pyrophosphohydrolase [Streptomyces thermolineatus]|uniref:Nucleoside triphosphate pyrophosphohydrolase n=1 Tax=Streptomyces thermolineatus TaxID=44033 RepID=A0ABN3ML85_9ACTN
MVRVRSGLVAASNDDTREAGTPGTGRLVLLTTTHRIAPGLLSWPAWKVLHEADRVVCSDPEHPQLPYLREAGIAVETAAPTARELVDDAASGEGRTVVVVSAADGDPALTDGLARIAGSGRDTVPELELLPGSYDLPGARLLDLVHVMDRLRSPGGCPWDAQQTHASLVKYLLEEAYELVETIEEDDREALREELGDVLLQVLFHSRIAEEHPDDPFSIDDVAGGIVDKLIHRHPHVFGSSGAPTTPAEIEQSWDRLKAQEKQRESVTEGVPLGQPALALAAKLVQRARRGGLDVPLPSPAAEPLGAEAPAAEAEGLDEERTGDLLLVLAARAAEHGIDPESALRAAARRYRDAVLAAERGAGPAAG